MSLSHDQCIEYLVSHCINFKIEGTVDPSYFNKHMFFKATGLHNPDNSGVTEIYGLTYLRALEGLVAAVKRQEAAVLSNVVQLNFAFKAQPADTTLDG
jgi:hypothetical protein